MANKVSYANLKLKVDNSIKTFDFNGNQIEVLQYLPIEDKYDLIMITLQKAKENGIYNDLKLDMYFALHIVYMYTNLSFTDKQKENESKIYDTLQSNGFFDKLLPIIPESEYDYLIDCMKQIMRNELQYNTTAAAIIKNLISDLPTNAAAAAQIVDNFNPEKYQAVIDFATAANGNRPIKCRKGHEILRCRCLYYYIFIVMKAFFLLIKCKEEKGWLIIE